MATPFESTSLRTVIIPSRKMWNDILVNCEINYIVPSNKKRADAYGRNNLGVTTIRLDGEKEVNPLMMQGYQFPRVKLPDYCINLSIFDQKESVIQIYKMRYDIQPTDKHLIFQQIFWNMPTVGIDLKPEDLPGLVKTIAIGNDWY